MEDANKKNSCPICGSNINNVPNLHHTIIDYYCPKCGDFAVENILLQFLPGILGRDIKKIAFLSHWIRSKHKSKTSDNSRQYEIPRLNVNLVETILKQKPPNPAEQANNIIRWLGENIEAPGEYLRLEPAKHQSIMGAITTNGFMLVIKHLINSGIIEGSLTLDPSALVTLSFEGWQHYEELKRGAIDSRKAFMAMKYDDPQLDNIVEKHFKPAVKQTGFDLFKLADRPKAGLIDDRLRVEIQTSRFLIADLTHENAGAYWEAGYAEGLGKPVIYTCEKIKFEEQKSHFDTNHHLTVIWDTEKPQEAAEELKATIRATLPGEAKLTDE